MAVYCPELNLSYIETPRTASIATSAFLIKYYNGKQISDHHHLNFPSNSFKISCVRNPYDLLCSIYCVFRNSFTNKDLQIPSWATSNEWKLFCNLQKTINISKFTFSQFIEYYPIIKFKLDRYYYMAQNGELDDWIYFEKLQDGIDRILALKGIKNEFKVEFVNMTKGKLNYLSLYTPSILGFVYKQNRSYCKFHGYYPDLI